MRLGEMLPKEFAAAGAAVIDRAEEMQDVEVEVPVAGTTYYYQKSNGNHEHRATSM